MNVEKQEITVIAFFIAFGSLWVAVIVPALTGSSWFYSLNPVLGYLAYNLGWILITSAVFGGLVSFLLFDEERIIYMIRVGIASWLFVSLIFDMLQPPFYLSPQGQVLIPLGTNSLENTAVDAAFAYVWSFVLGPFASATVGGFSVLYLFVYAVTPILAAVAAAAILAPRRFISLFMGGL
jgi:hypothetical protein